MAFSIPQNARMLPGHFKYLIHHIFLPPQLPQSSDTTFSTEHALVDVVVRHALEFGSFLEEDHETQSWDRIVQILKSLRSTIEFEVATVGSIERLLGSQRAGDVLAFLIRQQNAGLIIRTGEDETSFESFEVTPPNDVIMGTSGKLLCTFPGRSASVSHSLISNGVLRRELATVISQLDSESLDAVATTRKAGSNVTETRDAPSPHYVTEFLMATLGGLGKPVQPVTITKRIANEVLWRDTLLPWKRSPIWLLIRVAMQTTLHRADEPRPLYKIFMVFLLSRLLYSSTQYTLPDHLIFCMRAKLIRRVIKLGEASPSFVTDGVDAAVDRVTKVLQAKWEELQATQARSPSWNPEVLDLQEDTKISLVNSREYILQRLRAPVSQYSPPSFRPHIITRVKASRWSEASTVQAALETGTFIVLSDFERMVHYDIMSWTSDEHSIICKATSQWISVYIRVALSRYEGNPESMSIMLLTVFILWMIMDQAATEACNLLKEFSPEIPVNLFEPLLLSRRRHTANLRLLECYIQKRHDDCSQHSIFSDSTKKTSFPVRYFQSCAEMVQLKAEIEKYAESKRSEKARELERLNAQYWVLKAQAEERDHSYNYRQDGTAKHKKKKCLKCQMETRLKLMSISVHEWPLPSKSRDAQAAVFELRCPAEVRLWRDTTFNVLTSLSSHTEIHAAPVLNLCDYSGLLPFQRHTEAQRVGYASTTKSFYNSHYKGVSIPSVASSVCLNNGLTLRLFDKSTSRWASHPFRGCSIAHLCQFRLPTDSLFLSSERMVNEACHTPNQVISAQNEGPAAVSVHDWIAFRNIRAGDKIQWLNILRELCSQNLSCDRPEIYLLLLVASSQVGPAEQQSTLPSGPRTWHQELAVTAFRETLLEEMDLLLTSVEGNWMKVGVVDSIILLTTRMLNEKSRTRDGSEMRALEVLERARRITHRWLRQLVETSQMHGAALNLTELQDRVRNVAVSCKSTFDVPQELLIAVLSNSVNVAAWVECSIRIHQYSPNTPPKLGPHSRAICDRERRLTHELQSPISVCVRHDSQGLDAAISIVFPAFSANTRTTDWCNKTAPYSHWFRTSYCTGGHTTVVHLDFLSGELLLDGASLCRLPESISNDSTFQRLFKDYTLQVMPTHIAGMSYASTHYIGGHQLFFGQQGNTVIIRATPQGSPNTWFELIHRERFSNEDPHIPSDFPDQLINDFVHWMRLPQGVDEDLIEIEFRPRAHLWISRPWNWRLRFHRNAPYQSHMYHSIPNEAASIFVVDSLSPTFRMVARRLSPLEGINHIFVTLSPRGGLFINLYRLKLRFSVIDGELVSMEHADMVVDPSQDIGCFIGLQSQLVLKPKDAVLSSIAPRIIIVPFGELQKETSASGYTTVEVKTSLLAEVSVQVYQVDTDTRRLKGPSTMTSLLYAILLHAVTSHCLPDPLTGRTGSEEALLRLQAANCISFQRLSETELHLLQHIADLSPQRVYYPIGKMCMQSVAWDKISPLSQHGQFRKLVEGIVNHAVDLTVFGEGNSLHHYAADLRAMQLKDLTPSVLCTRARDRCAAFYSPDLSREGPHPGDTVYQSEAGPIFEPAGSKASHELASYVQHSRKLTPVRLDLVSDFTSWGVVAGTSAAMDGLSHSFSVAWFSPDLPRNFLPLTSFCQRHWTSDLRFAMVFSLSAMCFGSSLYRDFAPTLLAFTVDHRNELDFRLASLSYDLTVGFKPEPASIEDSVRQCLTTFADWSYAEPTFDNEAPVSRTRRLRESFKDLSAGETRLIVQEVINQWPSPTVVLRHLQTQAVSLHELSRRLQPLFTTWTANTSFETSIRRLQRSLEVLYAPKTSSHPFVPAQRSPSTSTQMRPRKTMVNMCTETILSNVPPRPLEPLDFGPPQTGQDSPSHPPYLQPSEATVLKALLQEFEAATTVPFRSQYGRSLQASREALAANAHSATHKSAPSMVSLLAYVEACRRSVATRVAHITNSLLALNQNVIFLYRADLGTGLSPISLLRLLASSCPSGNAVSGAWKLEIARLALDLVRLQQAKRMVTLCHRSRNVELARELETSLLPAVIDLTQLDWLLIQLDGDFKFRSIQRDVAMFMVDPHRRRNAVLQLNMGEGKSSVIVPLVSANLANGHTLVRTVVLKPLAPQMFQTLTHRLGGLANRPVFAFPFSRKITMDMEKSKILQRLYETCIKRRGVIVAQPEHLLSFKLMGIDMHLKSVGSASGALADSLVKMQAWLDQVSKDIFDESDELLHVKYQLVYSSGSQTLPDGHPERWTIAQMVLRMVWQHLPYLTRTHPGAIHVQQSAPGSFPTIRVLDGSVFNAMATAVATDFIRPYAQFPSSLLESLLSFITMRDVPKQHVQCIKEACRNTQLWKRLLLLRGLLAHGLLLYVLREKRWRVDYGLCSSRTLLAVPYRAKDEPSLKSDFGHPDVAILLTCLSYYYQGLDEAQLVTTFTLLFKTGDAGTIYAEWIKDAPHAPVFMHDITNINVEDHRQRLEFWLPHFAHNARTIDFYLSQVVFPRAAKQFSHKISASSWDLAACKPQCSVGFSGTNDNQYLLPTSVEQCDPVQQSSLNARVMSYLLQPENDFYACSSDGSGAPLPTESFLKLLDKQQPMVRVLLDVGAQMVDKTNLQLAQCWLSVTSPFLAQAVIFFNEDDELVVLDREGSVEPFLTSSFNQRLEQCLVYLDDAHTRGTDLKLPIAYRAAVTLGPKVTKDRLLQGCMRMRQLGQGQSVMFVAPPEVDYSIRIAMRDAHKASNHVQSVDILRWSMLETCKSILHHLPDWYQQGLAYQKRSETWVQLISPSTATKSFDRALRDSWVEVDSRSLSTLYGIGAIGLTSASVAPISAPAGAVERLRLCGLSTATSPSLDEEQEREVSHEMEVEREREVEHRLAPTPNTHSVHSDIRRFIRTGAVPKSSTAFVPASSNTPAILHTVDCARTLANAKKDTAEWRRPVHWVCSTKNEQSLVLLSPFEVNALLSDIRSSTAVHVHIYFPKVSRSSRPMDGLRFYAIPPLPVEWRAPSTQAIMELNLWAGQLFFTTYEDYQRLARFLGLYTLELKEEYPNVVIQADGFILPHDRVGPMQDECKYDTSPLPWLKEHLSQRRKGMDIFSTHMGKLLHGRCLTRDDF